MADSDRARAPEEPPISARAVVGRAQAHVREFTEDNLTDWAAALTYYAVLAIFPALLVLVSVLGLWASPRRSP